MGRTDATIGIGTPSLAVDSTAMVEAELLSIGSELLLGETVDTNAAYLARELAGLGIPLRHARMVPDDRAVIRDAFAEAAGALRGRRRHRRTWARPMTTSPAKAWPMRSERHWPRTRSWWP